MGFEANTGTGSLAYYGARVPNQKFGGSKTDRSGNITQSYTFSYDDLPKEGTDNLGAIIPAGSYIKSATLQVITAFAGGTSYDFGLYQSDGTLISAAGIDAAVALADLAANKVVACNGALVGLTANTGAADGELRVAATGTFTAGKAKLEITYVQAGV